MKTNSFFESQMNDAAYAEQVRAERERIEAVDRILRDIDAARDNQGLSKAELARLADKRESFVRRLLSGTDQNPTLDTVLALAHELGLTLTVQSR